MTRVARPQFLGDHEARHHGDADPRDRRQDDHLELLEADAVKGIDVAGISGVQPILPGARPARDDAAGDFAEIARMAHRL